MNRFLPLLRRFRDWISGLPTADEIIPLDLPEQSTVFHPTKGVGTLLFNGATEDNTVRVICVDFDGDICWMKPTETYLALYPEECESTELQ